MQLVPESIAFLAQLAPVILQGGSAGILGVPVRGGRKGTEQSVDEHHSALPRLFFLEDHLDR
jgi:hypothetical protein